MKKLALAAALALSFAAAQTHPMGSAGHDMASMPSMKALEKLNGRDFDSAFLSQMIGHHEVAVMMGAIQLAHGQKADVREMARKIIKDQADEMSQMQSWLKAWFGAAGASRTHLKMVMEENDPMLQATHKAAYGNVDRVFLQQMIPHHQGAVDMAKLALNKAARAEVKTMARNIISAQQKEISTFQALLKKGY